MQSALLSAFCSACAWELLTSPGRDTWPLQVSPNRELVLIYSKGWKAESFLAEKFTQMFKSGEVSGVRLA